MAIKKEGNNWIVRVTYYKSGIREECRRKFLVSEFTKGQVEAESKRMMVEVKEKVEKRLHVDNPRLIENVAKEYLNELEMKRVRLSTFETRRLLIGKHLRPFEGKYVDEISKHEIQQYVESLKVSVKTKEDIVKILRQVFQCAIDRRLLLDINPLRNMHIGKEGAIRSKNNKNISMTPDEVDKLLRHLKKINSPWYEIFLVAYYTGTRASETQALQWEDFDLERNLVCVSKTLQKNKGAKEQFGLTKNGEIRNVPISKTLKDFLIDKKERLNPSPTDFVLPRYSPWLKGRSAEYIREFQKELGITQTNYHALRGCFITHLFISNKVSEAVIREMVGHKDWSTTRRYFKMSNEYLKGATLALDREK